MKKKITFKQRIIKNDPIKNKEKTDLVNKTLIDIRKYYLKNVNEDPKLKFKILHFNKVLKSNDSEKNKEYIDTFIKLYDWGFNDKK